MGSPYSSKGQELHYTKLQPISNYWYNFHIDPINLFQRWGHKMSYGMFFIMNCTWCTVRKRGMLKWAFLRLCSFETVLNTSVTYVGTSPFSLYTSRWRCFGFACTVWDWLSSLGFIIRTRNWKLLYDYVDTKLAVHVRYKIFVAVAVKQQRALLYTQTFTQQNEQSDLLILGHVLLMKFKCIPTGIQLRSCCPHVEYNSMWSVHD